MEIRIAFIGLGERGRTALQLMLPVTGARVVALCDAQSANVEAAAGLCASGTVRCYSGPEAFREVCRCMDIDLVYICSDWASHAVIALEAMRCGKHAAVEVPAATTLDELWQLVRTSRETDRHCFLLENCCYDPALQQAISDIRAGSLGEPVHAEGSYYHHLGDRWSAWRLEMNRRQRGDLYPTHELAPLCMALGIGPSFAIEGQQPDRLQTLVCMDSAPFSGAAVYEQQTGHRVTDFQNGDHTVTLIRTARGRTILLKHDVLTEQPYQRLFSVIGTRDAVTITDNGACSHAELTTRMNERLIHQLIHHQPLDWDVTDLAAWCAVIPLTRLSIERGFMPVEFPDFTR